MTTTKPTVLVVEDDQLIRSMLRETLTQEGYDVETASDGDQGLALYRKKPADIVITDILMPNKEGLQLIKELRDISPDARIIAVSGGAANLQPGCNLELASMFGANCTFQKPLDIDGLLKTMSRLLEKE